MLRRGAAYFGLILLFALVLLALPGRASATVSYSAQEIEIVRLINEYRMSYGLDPVLVSDVLSDSAEKHSGDMAKYGFFSHYTAASDWFNVDSRPADRMVACGYPSGTWTGENIAAGYDTPATVMTAWKQSYAHNLNMLDTKWKVIGIGLVDMSGSSMGTYWTTDFGSYLDGSAHENGGTLPPDTTPPTVTITAPAQASEVSGTVTVSVTADDNRAVHHVELYANGVFVARDDASPYAVLWPSSSAPNGECNLEARAYDTSNNMAVATRLVYVSGSSVTTTTTPPSTTTTTTSTTTTSTTATTATTSTTSTTSPTSTTSTTVPAGGFADVPASSPFYQAVMALSGAGIFSGYEDGLFRPGSAITRSQFTKIIVLALEEHTPVVDNAADPTFVDVPYAGRSYPFDYVEEACGLGIITGYSDRTFAPSKKITRLQLAMMLVRAGGDDLPSPPSGYSCPFTDVPSYGRAAVATAYFNGIVTGKGARLFDPYSSATRGQAAKMVYSLCKILHKLP